jgi:hypothetical protein
LWLPAHSLEWNEVPSKPLLKRRNAHTCNIDHRQMSGEKNEENIWHKSGSPTSTWLQHHTIHVQRR